MKTAATPTDPHAFLAAVEHAGRRQDARTLCAMMERLSGMPPVLWGDSIVGFGSYRYTRADGADHTFLRTGFAPRKAKLAVYLMPGVARYADALARLGPHTHSVSCLYLGRLERIDADVLEEIVARSLRDMARMYPE